MDLKDLLITKYQAFYTATNRVTAESYPTMGTVIPAFNLLFEKMTTIMDDKEASDVIKAAAKKCNDVLEKYYIRTKMSPVCALGTGILRTLPTVHCSYFFGSCQ